VIDAETRAKYLKTPAIKTASGRPSLDCGDVVATKLRGKTDAELTRIAEINGLIDRWNGWGHLSLGQRRMSLGNTLRFMLKRKEKVVYK